MNFLRGSNEEKFKKDLIKTGIGIGIFAGLIKLIKEIKNSDTGR